MSHNLMQTAQQLINERQYDEARTILRRVDSPKAREWERKLDEIERPTPKGITFSTPPFNCPYCGAIHTSADSMHQRVSIAHDTERGVSGGGSLLGLKLAPPHRPTRSGLGILLLIGGGIAAAIFVLLILSFNAWIRMQGVFLAIAMVIACVLVALLGLYFHITDNRVYQRRRAAWDTAVLGWSSLYLCRRHGMVFDPDTQEGTSVDLMWRYLGWPP